MIVVDCSTVVNALASTAPLADHCSTRLGTDDLAAPYVLDLEVTNALRGQLLGGAIDQRLADASIDLYGSLEIERFAHGPIMSRVWQLRHNMTAYDAAYVALAERLQTSLVTCDAKLAGVPGIACTVEVIN